MWHEPRRSAPVAASTVISSDFNEGATLGLGSGDLSPRRTADLDVFALQGGRRLPVRGPGASGTLWTSRVTGAA